jgi:ABC-type uncharacterized transport system YnjBCD ATPase subunit
MSRSLAKTCTYPIWIDAYFKCIECVCVCTLLIDNDIDALPIAKRSIELVTQDLDHPDDLVSSQNMYLSYMDRCLFQMGRRMFVTYGWMSIPYG